MPTRMSRAYFPGNPCSKHGIYHFILILIASHLSIRFRTASQNTTTALCSDWTQSFRILHETWYYHLLETICALAIPLPRGPALTRIFLQAAAPLRWRTYTCATPVTATKRRREVHMSNMPVLSSLKTFRVAYVSVLFWG